MKTTQEAETKGRDAVEAVLPMATQQHTELKKVWADGAYAGPQVREIAKENGVEIEVVKRSDKAKGFIPLPKRWSVERSLGWLSRERRLSKDYERKESSSEAYIYLGMIRLMDSEARLSASVQHPLSMFMIILLGWKLPGLEQRLSKTR